VAEESNMAQVPIISQWQEARPYLLNQRATAERDLRRLLADQGAPFAICREVVSSIDHLGHLYKVDKERRNRALHRIIRGLFFVVAGRPLAADTAFHELDQKTGLALLEDVGGFSVSAGAEQAI
jgi:hypothetical protein